jgi:hypothetical protein
VPSGDLDVILAESKRLRYSTLRLLVSICHTLADSKIEDIPNMLFIHCLKYLTIFQNWPLCCCPASMTPPRTD